MAGLSLALAVARCRVLVKDLLHLAPLLLALLHAFGLLGTAILHAIIADLLAVPLRAATLAFAGVQDSRVALPSRVGTGPEV